jgi:ADP-heptose:LPS heptosyltransferase
MGLSNIHKILFITLSNVGDVILTLPVLSALKDNFPDAFIDVVVGPRPEEVFKKDPRVRKVFIYNKRAALKDKMRFIKRLKAQRYDLAIDMKKSLLPALIAAKNRTGLFPMLKSKIRHKRLIHLETLRPFGIKHKEQRSIHIDDESKNNIGKALKDSGVKDTDTLIGISPGSRSHLKQWKKQGFIDVINGIIKNPQYKVILTGDASESGLSREITSAVNQPGSIIDLTGKTSLSELFALIERLNLLLTCDSAGMHIASDLGVRVAAIFGPTDPREYGPRGDKDIVIRKDIKCSPCKKAQCRFGTHECMYSISAEEVLAAIRKTI